MRMRKGTVLSVTKIARSRVLAICACCNYHGLVDIGGGKNGFCVRRIAEYGSLALQIVHFPFSMPSACGLPTAPLLHMLDLDAGKDRQVMK